MLKQLQWKLTLICVVTTGIILSGMTMVLLFMSEAQVERQMEVTFQNSINSIIYKVQSSRVIEDTWLSQLEAGNSLVIHLEDQGTPIFFDGSWNTKTDRQELITTVQDLTASSGFDVKIKPISVINVANSETFEVIGDHGERYFAAAAVIPTGSSWTGLAAASHELRSPLSVIRAGLSALSLTGDPDQMKKYIKTADRECVRMAGLIDDLLILAGADSGSWSIHFRPVEIDTLIMELYEGFEPLAAKKNQKLLLHLPNYQLPQINGDKQRLWQAVCILLDNAVEYAPEKGMISISAELSKSKRNIVISVSDTGPGIPDEMKERVFDRFFRADASHTKKEHFGLGLSIAKEIVELHGGKITIGDTPEGGAAFQIKLPF